MKRLRETKKFSCKTDLVQPGLRFVVVFVIIVERCILKYATLPNHPNLSARVSLMQPGRQSVGRQSVRCQDARDLVGFDRLRMGAGEFACVRRSADASVL